MRLITNVENVTLRGFVGVTLDMLKAGVPLDAPIEMQRNRASAVTEISADTSPSIVSEPQGEDVPETRDDVASALQATLESGAPATPPAQ